MDNTWITISCFAGFAVCPRWLLCVETNGEQEQQWVVSNKLRENFRYSGHWWTMTFEVFFRKTGL